ncbi:MAG: hypothetical protein KGL34_03300 [Gammaproteobacteria bacterium]|nr:hypothetical protein [Gammaproteobacteria bacterium]
MSQPRLPCWTLLAWLVAFLPGGALAGGLADPTLAPSAPAPTHRRASEPPPRVSAIFASRARRVAIVDGLPVDAGDVVGDLTILSIEADGVRYRRHGREGFAPLRSTAP